MGTRFEVSDTTKCKYPLNAFQRGQTKCFQVGEIDTVFVWDFTLLPPAGGGGGGGGGGGVGVGRCRPTNNCVADRPVQLGTRSLFCFGSDE